MYNIISSAKKFHIEVIPHQLGFIATDFLLILAAVLTVTCTGIALYITIFSNVFISRDLSQGIGEIDQAMKENILAQDSAGSHLKRDHCIVSIPIASIEELQKKGYLKPNSLQSLSNYSMDTTLSYLVENNHVLGNKIRVTFPSGTNVKLVAPYLTPQPSRIGEKCLIWEIAYTETVHNNHCRNYSLDL